MGADSRVNERNRDITSASGSRAWVNASYRLTFLFLVDKRRPADLMGFKGDRYLDAVADLDEWNAFVHPVVLTVEGHCPLNVALACALAGKCKVQRLGLRDTSNGKGPLHIKGVGTGLHNLGRVKRDVWILVGVEEVFAL
jgi:hypothetical protein